MFKKNIINNKIINFEYTKKNFFTRNITENIVLTNIENDSFLFNELLFLGEEKLNNSVFFERGKCNLSNLKKFKEKLFTITYINSFEVPEFSKLGFIFIEKSPNKCYDYCVWRVNK